jgi:inorganic pyrophosphatase
MNLWHDLSSGNDVPQVVHAIIECPKGTKNKYEIDKETGLIKLDRAMKSSQDYPFDYGFVPQTLWDDGDALDVVLLTTYPLAPGILVEARPVALMHMIDGGEGDDKLIAVPKSDPRFDGVHDLSDLNPHLVKEMQHFFETYKTIEKKTVEVTGFGGREQALAAVTRSMELYQKQYGAK